MGRILELPLACTDGGDVLFRLTAYEPTEAAVVAIDSDGAALATFLRADHGLDVRDETSAPVARLVRPQDGFEFVETGGGALGAIGRSDHEIDGWIDDQWWLQPAGRLPLRRLAAVAMVLAAKVLLGRPSPVRAGADPAEEPPLPDRWLPGN